MMSFTPEQSAALSAPLSAAHVKTRNQAGRALSYIEGWHAIAEANRIFGFDAWDRDLVCIKQLGDPREVDGKWRVSYMATVRIRVRVTGSTIQRDGTGYGSGIDRDVGQAHESALKEAETDAMKRALMTFGNPFGLALYDKEQANVEAVTPPIPAERSRTKEQAPAKSVATYLETFRLAASGCDHEAEIRKLWKDETANRNKLGIASGSDSWESLKTICANRIEYLSSQITEIA